MAEEQKHFAVMKVRTFQGRTRDVIGKAETQTTIDSKETSGVEWIEPDLPLKGLKELCNTSAIIPQCVDAYGANIAGYGLEVAYSVDTIDGETSDMKAEWDTLTKLLKVLSLETPVSSIFVEAVKERERCGIAYIECIRDMEGNVVELVNVRDTEYVRKSRQQEQEVDYTVCVDGVEMTRKKRFRKYRQQVNGRRVYLKEFGDPRTMNRMTGEYTSEPITLCEQANELIELTVGTGHYGTVRWVGQIVTIDGCRAAENLNDNYFQNGRHTPFAMILSGGTLTSESESEIQSYLDGVKGEQGQHKILLLQVESKAGRTGMEEKEKPSLEIKDLTPMLQKDALFLEYQQSGRKSIQSAFRLPEVYLAYTSDYNRSTVEAAMRLTDEQVFRTEREHLEWLINNKILSSYKFKYVHVAVKAPDLRDSDSENRRFSIFAEHGGLTPNMAKDGIAHMMGLRECEEYSTDWANTPLKFIDKLTPADKSNAIEKAQHSGVNEAVIPLLRSIDEALKRYEED